MAASGQTRSGPDRPPTHEPAGTELINPEKLLLARDDYESALLRLRSIKPRPGCFCFGCRGFRSRRPSPPPFSSMNTIPARSKAAWIASTAARETSRRPFSKSTTVESPRLAASASCDCVISSSPRAARHWAGVIGSTFFVDTLSRHLISIIFVDGGLTKDSTTKPSRWERIGGRSVSKNN